MDSFCAITPSVSKKAPEWSNPDNLLWNGICLPLSICPFRCFEVDPRLKQSRAHWNRTRGRKGRERNLFAIHVWIITGKEVCNPSQKCGVLFGVCVNGSSQRWRENKSDPVHCASGRSACLFGFLSLDHVLHLQKGDGPCWRRKLQGRHG